MSALVETILIWTVVLAACAVIVLIILHGFAGWGDDDGRHV